MSQTKTCGKCGAVLPASREHFYPHKLGTLGLHPNCKPCERMRAAASRARPDQMARQKAWRDANKERVKQYNEQYRKAGYKSTEAVRAWRAANLEYAREKERLKMREWRKTPEGLLASRLRTYLGAVVRRKGGKGALRHLDYTVDELRQHIERQFKPGMSWERLYAGDIEIDHIIPVAHFRISSIDDPDLKVCWGLPNLRPLWKAENRSKNKRIVTLL